MTPPTVTSAKPATARTHPTPDAIALLKADHARVQELFDAYDHARAPSRKQSLIREICCELSMHMQIEEEILYPAIAPLKGSPLLVPEAMVEHAGIRDLIIQLEAFDGDTPLVEAQVKVLAEYVQHHVKEEHESLFPLIEDSSIDRRAMGARMVVRKRRLMAPTA